MINLIVAYDNNRVIGNDNELPWYLPADLKRFKELTTGNSVVMGRKTFDSITVRIGKPLPNRENLVVSRNPELEGAGIVVAGSIEAALQMANSDSIYIIGGGQVYEQTLPFADKVFATEVDTEAVGDVYFPVLETGEWEESDRQAHSKDDKNPYNYSFVTYTRK